MSRSIKLSLWIIFIILVILISGSLKKGNKEFVSPFAVNPFAKSDLKRVMEDVLKDTEGRYGIFIKNLKTNEKYFLNEHQTFEAGSLYKLWVMGAIFEKIKAGNLKEDKILSDKIEHLNIVFNIASDEAELKEGEIEMSVNSALEQMITISHNYAALLLSSEVGISKTADFLRRYGFNESSVGDEVKTTTSDVGKFFEKLYKGEIVDVDFSKQMLEILSRQKINDRIPKLLPEGIIVAHKTADIGFFEHDVGIVFTPKGDYIIVVLTETDFPQSAGERIADLSEAVFKYFNPFPHLF